MGKKRGDAYDGEVLVTLGWGVRLDGPRAWLSPDGEVEHPFWWGRRGDAERLALRYAGLGRGAHIVHASRKASCTSPALNPWDEGYDPTKHTSMCGRSIVQADVPNQTAVREAIRAQKRHERELRAAAKAEALFRAQQRREAKARDPFGHMPGAEGDAEALLVLLKAHGAITREREELALAHIKRTHPGARDVIDDEGHLNSNWIRDELCTLARDSLRNNPKLAAKLLKAAGRGECRTAEKTRERMAHDKAKARKSRRAADRIRKGAAA